MSARTDVDKLIELPDQELESRVAAAYDRLETRMTRCRGEARELSDREFNLSQDDRDELSALKDALGIKEESHARMAALTEALESAPRTVTVETRGNLSPLFPSAENLRRLEEARRTQATLTLVEERAAIKTTDAGTGREYAPSGLLAPRTLWRAAGIPTTAPDGYEGVTPKFTLPAGVALVAEGVAHAEFDSVTPDSVQLGRAGAWSDLTTEGLLSTSLTEITAAHARIVARNVDLATVDKIEGAPSALDVDTALVTVAAECACDVSDLWIVGDPAAVSSLVGVATAMTPANAGDVGSFALRYGGAQIYPTPGATVLTVFHPQSFRAFASGLASAVVTDPTTGSQRFGQWMLFGLGQSLVGSAVSVSGT